MYDILLKDVKKAHEFEELIKIFLRPSEFRLFSDDTDNVKVPEGERPDDESADFVFEASDDKNVLKKDIYLALRKLTGIIPSWGIITGIRPVKLAGEIVRSCGGSFEEARRILLDSYCVTEEKADKALDIYRYQQDTSGQPDERSVSVYIGIPFCPTRCLYCSFTSNQKDEKEISRYLESLDREMDMVAGSMDEMGLYAESVYRGGGTPTTLDAETLGRFLEKTENLFISPETREFTLEAGRADTITEEKLSEALRHGVDRISVNPQSMKQETLDIIGRETRVEEIEKAFSIAAGSGIRTVNADIIAGLPSETADDFAHTLDRVLSYGLENVTVHDLAVKRSSRLAGVDRDYHYKAAKTVSDMLRLSEERMSDAGYRAYYLYRQKQMAGAGENTGYCLAGHEGLYNIRIMEEAQTIIALGAGGISKVYFPSENRHERVANVSNYEIYIERTEEMLERKRKNLFWPLKKYREEKNAY